MVVSVMRRAAALGERGRRRARLLDDAEVSELTGKSSPTGVDSIYPRGAGALLRPTVQLPNTQLLAFGEDFY
jgi:hypothetical protein